MAQEIVQIQQMGDALRNTGYKNIGSAISEIVDNSIEAHAKDIFIIVTERLDPITNRNFVDEIAILDNGDGMDYEKLSACLGIGFTTRSERKGMGRFGVGLPQSSLHVCPAVDVYSWQNGIANSSKVSLDINKVKSGEQTIIEDPQRTNIPSKYQVYLSYKIPNKNYDFKTSGTFVYWKECDRVSPKTIRFLFRDLTKVLGQKFRYMLNAKKINIRLIDLDNNENFVNIMPNDPLMLMNDNYVLGNASEPGKIDPGRNSKCTEMVFEPFTNSSCLDGVVTVPVNYYDKETRAILRSAVTVKFSKVRNIFYDKTAIPGDPGSTDLGKHVKEMEGISIIRADREIDFAKFDFYDSTNEPQHRWWGCEISFAPELDEAFGVANNKQSVELKKVDLGEYSAEEIKPMWLQLYSVVHNTISEMYKVNKATRENARTIDDITSPAVDIINTAEFGNQTPSLSDEVKKATPTADLLKKGKEELNNQGVEKPTDEATLSYINNKVNISYANLGKGPFFDYSFALGTASIKINMDHDFYKKAYIHVLNNNETKVAFELFIASLVRTMDELAVKQNDQNELLMAEWNNKLRVYINAQNNR